MPAKLTVLLPQYKQHNLGQYTQFNELPLQNGNEVVSETWSMILGNAAVNFDYTCKYSDYQKIRLIKR